MRLLPLTWPICYELAWLHPLPSPSLSRPHSPKAKPSSGATAPQLYDPVRGRIHRLPSRSPMPLMALLTGSCFDRWAGQIGQERRGGKSCPCMAHRHGRPPLHTPRSHASRVVKLALRAWSAWLGPDRARASLSSLATILMQNGLLICWAGFRSSPHSGSIGGSVQSQHQSH